MMITVVLMITYSKSFCSGHYSSCCMMGLVATVIMDLRAIVATLLVILFVLLLLLLLL